MGLIGRKDGGLCETVGPIGLDKAGNEGAEHVPSALERLVVFAFVNVLLIPLTIIKPYLATIFLLTITF